MQYQTKFHIYIAVCVSAIPQLGGHCPSTLESGGPVGHWSTDTLTDLLTVFTEISSQEESPLGPKLIESCLDRLISC